MAYKRMSRKTKAARSRSRSKFSQVRSAGTIKYRGKWNSQFADRNGEFILVSQGVRAPKRVYITKYKNRRKQTMGLDYPKLSAAKFKKIVNSYKKKSKSKSRSKPKRRTYKKKSKKRSTRRRK